MKIIVSPEIESVCPSFVGACVEASVVNTQYCQELWDEIEELGRRYKQKLTTESLKDMSGIAAPVRYIVPVARTHPAIALPQKH